jgi:hypothetical protein
LDISPIVCVTTDQNGEQHKDRFAGGDYHVSVGGGLHNLESDPDTYPECFFNEYIHHFDCHLAKSMSLAYNGI